MQDQLQDQLTMRLEPPLPKLPTVDRSSPLNQCARLMNSTKGKILAFRLYSMQLRR